MGYLQFTSLNFNVDIVDPKPILSLALLPLKNDINSFKSYSFVRLLCKKINNFTLWIGMIVT